jgi:hypothetical protein
MNYQQTMRILRGSQRYKGALDKDITIPYTFDQTHRMLIETERNSVLNLSEQYFAEREESTNYRIYGKVKPIVDNIISGETSDPTMLGFQTYYYPPFPPATDTVGTGYPSINFFEFFVPTALTTVHNYVETNSYKDNWLVYASYVYTQRHKTMLYTSDKTTSSGIEFKSSDGIPFTVSAVTINGKDALQCTCPVEHGLLEGEYIELQDSTTITPILINQVTTINGSVQLPVYSFGNEFVGTEKKIFNILLRPDITIPNTFVTGDCGIFKRLSDPANYDETLSKYYIHAHKLLTDIDESVIDRAAFEVGIYNKRFRYYRNDNSPPFGIGHEVVKNQSASYLWNFNRDLDVKYLRDNLNKPIKDLYVSIFVANQTNIWQNREITTQQTQNGPVSVVTNGYGIGWDWNFIADGEGLDEYPLNYFTQLNTPTNIPTSGDSFLGAFVEYNEFELKERIISEAYHTLRFNADIFASGVKDHQGNVLDISEGYYYQPHHRIPIRKVGNNINTYPDYRFVPSYATFSIYEQLWRWRTILEIGFYDSATNGLDYPFVNGSHYPFKDIEFLIKPIVWDKPYLTDGIIGPIDDDCE